MQKAHPALKLQKNGEKTTKRGHRDVFTSDRKIENIERNHGFITLKELIKFQYGFHKEIGPESSYIGVKYRRIIISWRRESLVLENVVKLSN